MTSTSCERIWIKFIDLLWFVSVLHCPVTCYDAGTRLPRLSEKESSVSS